MPPNQAVQQVASTGVALFGDLPFTDVLSTVFTGSGECAEIVWQFLGLSMPAWVLVWMAGIGIGGIWNNLRRG